MSLNRYARRRDETEPAIVDGLRKVGYQVRQQDFPDLLTRHRSTGRVALLEVNGITKNRKRTADQLAFLSDWQIPIVNNFDEALAALQNGGPS